MGKTLRNTVETLTGRADAALTKAAQDNRGNAVWLPAVKSGAVWTLANDAPVRAAAGARINVDHKGTTIGSRALNTPEYLASLQAGGVELVSVDEFGAVQALRYVEEDM